MPESAALAIFMVELRSICMKNVWLPSPQIFWFLHVRWRILESAIGKVKPTHERQRDNSCCSFLSETCVPRLD
jgi:hypothetical protein